MNATAPGMLEILTPSYAPDFELCRDLVDSVTRFAPPGTGHRIVVPDRDRRQFDALASDRVVVQTVSEVLPSHLHKVPGWNGWVNSRAPWPPIRGWIAQQLVKLAATASSTSDAVLIVDSDVVFVRPFSVASWRPSDSPLRYRIPDAVTSDLPRHMIWDAVARRLVGLAPSAAPAHPDYISWPCLWDPRIVRMLLTRVEEATGMRWSTAIGRELHFSEMVLYGVFMDEFVARAEAVTDTSDMRCANHSDETALDAVALPRFLGDVSEFDLAVMVSAKSGTDLKVRRQAIADFTDTLPA